MEKQIDNYLDMEPENVARKVRDFQHLLDVAKAMTRIRDLDELLLYIRETAMDIADADRCTIFLVDYKTNELSARFSDQEMKEIRFPLGVGVAGQAAITNTCINIPDAYADERFNPEVDRKTRYRTRSLLTVPLANYEDKIIGVIQIVNKKHGRAFTEYDEAVLAALGSNAAIAIETAQLLEHYIEKQQIEAELNIAKSIQEGLLPLKPPQVEGYDIFGFSQSADETGGDYFDYFFLPDGRLCSLVGDVSGHGIGAALLMTSARAYLKGITQREYHIDKIVAELNSLLERDCSDEKFMTMYIQALDLKTNKFEYISAGHDQPLYWRARDKAFFELPPTGIPLGIMHNIKFKSSEMFSFEKGDYIFISSDGIREAPNAELERFGKKRLNTTLGANAHLDAKERGLAVINNVEKFTAGYPQADDWTMVIMERTS